MPSNHLTLCCPLFLPPSVFPSIRVFSSESVLCIRWLKYWSFSFSISPSNEYAGLISFRMDWLDLFAVQGTLKNHLQHHVSWIYVLKSLLISWWKGEINCTLLREEIQKPYIKQLYVKHGKKKKKTLFGEVCSKTSVPDMVVKPIPGPRHFALRAACATSWH